MGGRGTSSKREQAALYCVNCIRVQGGWLVRNYLPSCEVGWMGFVGQINNPTLKCSWCDRGKSKEDQQWNGWGSWKSGMNSGGMIALGDQHSSRVSFRGFGETSLTGHCPLCWEMYWLGGETSVNKGSSWRPCSWPGTPQRRCGSQICQAGTAPSVQNTVLYSRIQNLELQFAQEMIDQQRGVTHYKIFLGSHKLHVAQDLMRYWFTWMKQMDLNLLSPFKMTHISISCSVTSVVRIGSWEKKKKKNFYFSSYAKIASM